MQYEVEDKDNYIIIHGGVIPTRKIMSIAKFFYSDCIPRPCKTRFSNGFNKNITKYGFSITPRTKKQLGISDNKFKIELDDDRYVYVYPQVNDYFILILFNSRSLDSKTWVCDQEDGLLQCLKDLCI